VKKSFKDKIMNKSRIVGKLIRAIIGLTMVASNVILNAQTPKYKNPKTPIEERIKDLLSRMTIEEKVAQMRMFHANLGIDLTENNTLKLTDTVIKRLQFGIGGIKNPGELIAPEKSAFLNNLLQKYIIEHSRLGIPALFVGEAYNGIDAEGCTKFGRPMAQAASFNPDLVHQIWDIIGREARWRGFNMCHSPEADLARDPRFGRMSETFGEDTHLTTEMVVSAVTGVQGDYEGLKNTHIGAVTKHFAGYAQILGGKNFAAIEISPRTLADEILPPFKAAVQRAKTLGIMASHGDLNGVASHANPELLTNILRNQWGFKGYTVSDANDIARLNFFMHVAETPEDAVIMALKAGMDVDLYSDVAYALLPKMVKTQPDLIKNIDMAAARVLRTKFTLGLFDNPYTDVKEVEKNIRTDKALALARLSDLESIILLKNDTLQNTPILPLKTTNSTYKNIALLGPILTKGAKEDFEKIAGKDFIFTEEKGFDLTNKNKDVPKLNLDTEGGMQKMLDIAKASDACILFLGGDEFEAKEGFFNNALGDRASIDPVGRQDEFLQKVKALGKPIIVVLKHRRTLSINEITKSADAILDCWDMSEFGNEAVAKMIFGQANPSGKSPVTIPRSIGQLPFHYSQKEINYKKGYLFQENGPLYPFGFGLSYTQFSYNNLKLSTNIIAPNSTITVTVDVKNTGNITGKEVVQLYIKDIIGSVTRPDKELKAFQKIELKSGETKQVSFIIKPEMLEFTTLKMVRELEAGDYQLMVGTSSQMGLKAGFKLVKK
jgi:beta-glucosidase